LDYLLFYFSRSFCIPGLGHFHKHRRVVESALVFFPLVNSRDQPRSLFKNSLRIFLILPEVFRDRECL
jgi:hypothetical protein